MNNNKNILHGTFLESWHPFFWIAFAVLFVYFTTLFSSIVYLDDNALVTGQYQFNKDLTNIPQAFNQDIFQTPHHGGTFYRPIERITFILDAQFGERAIVFMSHFTNILLHIIALCLLFKFLTRLNIKKEISFLLTLIFAVHPLTAQTVAFIAGRNDSLLAIFILLSLIYFIDFLQTRKNKQFVWHLIFFTIALFTKETAVMLPVICTLYLLIFVIWKKIKEEYKLYIFRFGSSWIIIVGLWFLARRAVMHNFIGNADYNMFYSVFKNLPSLIPAIGKVFLPFELSVFPVIKDMNFIYGIISLIVLVAWFILSEKKNIKLILFGFLWFGTFVVLTLIKPIGTVAEFSENRIYIPMFGFIFVVLGLGWIRLPKSLKEKIHFEINKEKIIIIASIIIILIFSTVTIYRNRYYKNGLSFWQNATETSPSYAFNHNNLGAMYYLNGNLSGAENEFKKALELNPYEPMSHSNLGLVYSNQNKLKEAEEEYKNEIEINSDYDNAYYNLGLLYKSQNKYDEAIDNWKKTLVYNPSHIDAMKELAVYFYEKKDYENAVPYLRILYNSGVKMPDDIIRLLQLSSI